MSDADKPELRPANKNPWYCLATLHGEQPVDGWHSEPAKIAWPGTAGSPQGSALRNESS